MQVQVCGLPYRGDNSKIAVGYAISGECELGQSPRWHCDYLQKGLYCDAKRDLLARELASAIQPFVRGAEIVQLSPSWTATRQETIPLPDVLIFLRGIRAHLTTKGIQAIIEE